MVDKIIRTLLPGKHSHRVIDIDPSQKKIYFISKGIINARRVGRHERLVVGSKSND